MASKQEAYRFEVNPENIEKAAELAAELFGKDALYGGGQFTDGITPFSLRIRKAQIPDFNRLLVENGIAVFAFPRWKIRWKTRLLQLREEGFPLHKLGALFHNEIIKSRKKVSIYIIVIVMTVGMIGCSTFIKSTEYQDVIEGSSAASYEEYLKYAEELENRIRECEEALADEALSPNEASELKEQLHNLELEYIYYDIYGNYAKEQNIGNLSYRYGILEDLVAARQSLLDMEYSAFLPPPRNIRRFWSS